jgi:hypothetical protein
MAKSFEKKLKIDLGFHGMVLNVAPHDRPIPVSRPFRVASGAVSSLFSLGLTWLAPTRPAAEGAFPRPFALRARLILPAHGPDFPHAAATVAAAGAAAE